MVYRAEATFVGVGLWDLYGALVSPGAKMYWDKQHEDAVLLEDVNELTELWHFKTKPAWPAKFVFLLSSLFRRLYVFRGLAGEILSSSKPFINHRRQSMSSHFPRRTHTCFQISLQLILTSFAHKSIFKAGLSRLYPRQQHYLPYWNSLTPKDGLTKHRSPPR